MSDDLDHDDDRDDDDDDDERESTTAVRTVRAGKRDEALSATPGALPVVDGDAPPAAVPPAPPRRSPTALRAAYWVFRREIHDLLRAPLLYVLGGGFLGVQGIAFAALVAAYSDPLRPAPLGALLEGQLGGTLLTWILGLAVLALLGMRSIAEDRRQGTWELLLTAQVGEGAAVIGKWLAAVVVYALLWVPTLAYLAVVAIYRADTSGWDVGSIACGYAGAIAIGAALLAWAIAASAATSSLLVAGGLAFALLLGFLLVGELPVLWPGLASDHPQLAAVFGHVSLRGTAASFARGEVTGSTLALVLGLTLTGLALAIALATTGRRRPAEVRARVASSVLVATAAILVGVLAARHPVRWDLSDTDRNSLDPATLDVLANVAAGGQPVTLTIVQPTLAGLAPIYDEVERVAVRMHSYAPQVTVHRTDPAVAPGGLAAIARTAGLAPTDLAASGAIIVEVGDRKRVVDFLAIATIARGPGDAPTVERLAIEQALTGAIAALERRVELEICVTSNHGELASNVADPGSADWTVVGNRLRGDGMTVRILEIVDVKPDASAMEATNMVPTTCRVLLVAGPTTPFTPEEAFATQEFVRAGGALVVAGASRPLPGSGALASTGLEAILVGEGLGIASAIAVDPALAVRELPGALLVTEGYAHHPINSGFARTRALLWYQPRPVLVERGAEALVSATAGSWGETDLVSSPQKQGSDLAGPVVLAALGRSGRVIAIGSAESFSSALLGGGASAGDLWLLRAIRFAAGATDVTPSGGVRTPEQVRLVLSPAARSAIIALCVGVIPLAWTVLGGLVLLWRRRRARSAA